MKPYFASTKLIVHNEAGTTNSDRPHIGFVMYILFVLCRKDAKADSHSLLDKDNPGSPR